MGSNPFASDGPASWVGLAQARSVRFRRVPPISFCVRRGEAHDGVEGNDVSIAGNKREPPAAGRAPASRSGIPKADNDRYGPLGLTSPGCRKAIPSSRPNGSRRPCEAVFESPNDRVRLPSCRCNTTDLRFLRVTMRDANPCCSGVWPGSDDHPTARLRRSLA